MIDRMNRAIGAALLAGICTIPGSAPGQDTGASQMPATSEETPVPDLGGYWNGRRSASGMNESTGEIELVLSARDGDLGNFEKDFAVLERSHPNKPLYKPEHWDTIQDMDWNGLTRDPVFSCLPAGVPRAGPPDRIVQTPGEIVFFYEQTGTFRSIPMDGREHHRLQVADATWYGYSVGHWEGDTLVIETVGFNDRTWLAWPGYIHSWDMKVTERVRRVADTLHWIATVEDPMLIEPWTLDPIVRTLNTDPEAFLWEGTPCEERDADRIIDRNVRG